MSGKPTTWAQEVRHAGLNKRRVVQGPERRLVEEMAAALGAQWDADWERLCETERGRSAVRDGPRTQEALNGQAIQRTDAAVAALASLSAILLDGLNADSRVDREGFREGFKEQATFAEPKPIPRAGTPVPSSPDQNAQKYQSRLGPLAFFSGKRRRAGARAASEAYERDRAAWSEQTAKITAYNEASRQDYAKAVADWEARRARHLAAQRRRLQSIDDRARGAIEGRQAGIAELIELARVAAARLGGPSPVAPPEGPRLTGRRFVSARDVASSVDAGANIAAMGWRDFEHLVRQVFESEFASEAGEVRVTQATRDGGVDAVVFNPDPIKGGKIVIQAKRYTSTVDVSAVRDLYGTVVNEGASKGILVTTSQFGPDARKFVLGKPLTLIDGGNLLFLLKKMGVKARIDLKEAKFLLAKARRPDSARAPTVATSVVAGVHETSQRACAPSPCLPTRIG